jgi:hypothetical protein
MSGEKTNLSKKIQSKLTFFHFTNSTWEWGLGCDLLLREIQALIIWGKELD